jgi:methyl-accepting chemotaxis protein
MNTPMQWMRRFSIRLRMQGAVALVLGLFALVGAAGLLGGQHLSSLNADFMQQTVRDLHTVADLRGMLGNIRRHEKDMVIQYEDSAAVAKLREVWNSDVKQAQASLASLLEGAGADNAALAQATIQQLQTYATGAVKVLDQIQNNAYDTARVADKMLARAKTHIHAVETNLSTIEKAIDTQAAATQARFEASMRLTMWAFVGVLLLVILLVVPLTLMNSASVTGPMTQARDLAMAIADGQLGQPVQVEGRDEAAELLRALAHMQGTLGGLVGEVRQAADSIHTAANEVASGNTDLSGRTEQAAGSLQQTAGAMQQLTQSVQHSASSARHASDLAASACSVAERGGAVVAQVVSTMDEINSSSKRIADIIGTIDGIAFQTNILALNAAVEAARAGEQGRGFAVVASEVRSLAQRSAAAAREIKSLIASSVEKVDAGTRQVRDAGQTMGDIVVSVQRVTETIREISAAAGEQSQGIGSVNQAVNALDQMTQQNAALVEQSAAAAESLKDQAGRLSAVVARFQVADTVHALAGV